MEAARGDELCLERPFCSASADMVSKYKNKFDRSTHRTLNATAHHLLLLHQLPFELSRRTRHSLGRGEEARLSERLKRVAHVGAGEFLHLQVGGGAWRRAGTGAGGEGEKRNSWGLSESSSSSILVAALGALVLELSGLAPRTRNCIRCSCPQESRHSRCPVVHSLLSIHQWHGWAQPIRHRSPLD